MESYVKPLQKVAYLKQVLMRYIRASLYQAVIFSAFYAYKQLLWQETSYPLLYLCFGTIACQVSKYQEDASSQAHTRLLFLIWFARDSQSTYHVEFSSGLCLASQA